jgi:tRNA wybutosine-synthesizing protein 2
MQYRSYLESHLEGAFANSLSLPRGYHVIGHVALISTSIDDSTIIKKIAQLTIEYDPKVKSVAVKTGPTASSKRIPSYRLVVGDPNTLTTHIENGVKFRLDPLRITFSGGNRRERIDFPVRVRDGEHVVDMFACVGQFGLHVATHTLAKVTAIEINPIAFEFLEENIRINNVQNRMNAILGDCREVNVPIPGDRIIMGYLHDTLDYLPYALDILASKGGWIHLHVAIPKTEIPLYCNTISTIGKQHNYHTESFPREIKTYSPGITHLVFDIKLVAI